jgi:uncharacterized membrane protein
MNMPIGYVVVSVVVLAVIAVLVFLTGRRREQNRLTPLAGLAFAFVVVGIIFGEERIIGYGLMGVGVILAVVDIVNRSRAR